MFAKTMLPDEVDGVRRGAGHPLVAANHLAGTDASGVVFEATPRPRWAGVHLQVAGGASGGAYGFAGAGVIGEARDSPLALAAQRRRRRDAGRRLRVRPAPFQVGVSGVRGPDR